jgi:hypothetical protein
MPDVLIDRKGVPVLVCDPDGATVATEQDALDLIASAPGDADVIAIPVSRLDERFFRLDTGLAGQVMQKFVNYRVRLAVVGDISAHLARGSALPSLVRESNRGRHVWFVDDLDALDAHLP